MSYSFHVRGVAKDGVFAALAAKLDEIVIEQPVHAKDRDAIEANALAIIDLMPDPPEGMDLVVTCNGYVVLEEELPEDPAKAAPVSVNVSCYAHYIASDLEADGSGKAREQAQ